MSAREWLAWAGAMLVLAGAGVLCRLRAWWDRDEEMLAPARLLELLLAADLAAMALKQLVLAPARIAGLVPYSGPARLVFHATQLAFLAWPFGAAWLCARLFARRKDPALAPATLVVGTIAAALFANLYPELRGERLVDAYRWAHLFAVGVCLGTVFFRRDVDLRLGRAHLVALLIVAGAAAELAGPYIAAPFASWWTAQASWSLALAAVALAATWRRPWGMAPAS